MISAATTTAVVTIGLAFLGYVATYINNVRLTQRKARLDRVNRQLSEFYGPLLAIRGASTEAWFQFVRRHGFKKGHFSEGRASDEDLELFRLWMRTVFRPGNLRMYELILSKSDLLIDDDMPQALLDVCTHVLAYEVVFQRWEAGDFQENVSIIRFPSELDDYAKQSFAALKQEQARLIGGSRIRRPPEVTA